MAWNLTSPVTGAAQTGLTSPTYTLSTDTAPEITGKQMAVTALGGTQTGVTTHSATVPFTVTHFRPKVFKALGMPNPTTGVISSVPYNVHKVIVRKGVTPAASQQARPARVTVLVEVPAGAETYDAPNVRAMLSLAIGALSQQSAGVGDTVVSGIQ